jgi:hypothetical protein
MNPMGKTCWYIAPSSNSRSDGSTSGKPIKIVPPRQRADSMYVELRLHWDTTRTHMKATAEKRMPPRRREALLKARWEPRLLERFASAARTQGRTAPEVLRVLALDFIEQQSKPYLGDFAAQNQPVTKCSAKDRAFWVGAAQSDKSHQEILSDAFAALRKTQK